MADETAPQADDFPTGWRPESGDKLTGAVTDISTGQGGYDPYPIVTLQPDDGGAEVAVHAFHTVLRRELARRRPKIGTHLEITYLGKKGDGREAYHLYRVRGEGDKAGYDWDRELPEEERATPPASDITPDLPPMTTGRDIAEREPATVPQGAQADTDGDTDGDDLPF